MMGSYLCLYQTYGGMVFRANFEDPKFLAQRMQNRSKSPDKGITDVSFHITSIRISYEYCNAL